MAKAGLNFLNGLVSAVVAIALLVTALYAGYALWDNHQIYHAAESVFDEMKEIKARMAAEARAAAEAEKAAEAARIAAERAADAEAAEKAAADAKAAYEETFTSYGAPFEELKAINPDVNGWLTMPGTAIDYPLVRGESNFSYINTDVYGNFALSGSIFLDSRNDEYYLDVYSLLYGHNMSRHRMFGDVNLYKDESFFNANRTGTLYLPDRAHALRSISCVVTSASDYAIFNPTRWNSMTAEEILNNVQEQAKFISTEGLSALKAKLDAGERPRILALSTCSDEFTDARTVLLTLID